MDRLAGNYRNMADYSEDFDSTTVLGTSVTAGVWRDIAIRFGKAGANVVVTTVGTD